MGKDLNVSIVLFNSDFYQISNLIYKLRINNSINQIYLIDNSPKINLVFETCCVNYIYTGKNLGYGSGHNIAIRKTINSGIKYHLVLNSDICIDNNIIENLLEYMESNTEVGLIMPMIKNEDGTTQLLPKLLPSPMDLLIRVIPFIKKFASKRIRNYVLEDYQDHELNVPIISGCFSLFKTEVFKEIGVYDEKFFMYFEDFDLSRRIHRKFRTIYFPFVSITHFHERGATKSIKLFIIFIRSAVYYFHKYGWFLDKERSSINKNVFNQIK